jgi:hypothetical protein
MGWLSSPGSNERKKNPMGAKTSRFASPQKKIKAERAHRNERNGQAAARVRNNGKRFGDK